MNIIDDWRQAPRMFSVWAAIAAIAWGLLPWWVQSPILAYLGLDVYRLPLYFGAAFLFARLVNQPSVRDVVSRGIG